MSTPPDGWTEIAPGVWSRTFGTTEAFGPIGLLGATPAREAMARLGAADHPSGALAPDAATFPLDPGAITAETIGGRTVIRLPLAPGEPVFGLGLQFVRLNHRGRTRFLRVNSDPKEDTGETHAPVPFYVVGGTPGTAAPGPTAAGFGPVLAAPAAAGPVPAGSPAPGPAAPAPSPAYGVLVNTARIVTIHCASTVPRAEPTAIKDRNQDRDWAATPPAATVEIALHAPGAEILVFAGPTPLDVVRRYNLFFGGGCLPPRWGLGFWHRTPTKFTAEQVAAEATEYRRRGFPCDVIGLEPGWHTASYPCTYQWSPDRFPDPAAFTAAMATDGFKVNLWEHPWVSPRAAIHAPLEPLSGTHTVWGGLAPDYTLPEARAITEAQHEAEHVQAGVSGYKLDECDGSELTGNSWMFPAHAAFPSGRDGEQMRQVYGLLLQQMTAGLFRRHDRRTYGLVRASSTGASPLPYALYTDLYDHRRFVRALCNASFSGLLFAPEVRSAKAADDWVRRMQTACFSPLAMLNAWSSGTKPWSFPEVEGIVRKFIELRMRLLPYFYSAFARYRIDGTPPFRAMALEPGGAATADDQYMAGGDILVAPLFAAETQRKVVLPPGGWYDFETGERFEGGGTIAVAPALEAMPVFVRDGGIVPLMPPLPHAPAPRDTVALEVRHYGRRPGHFRLYDDDGETFAYERGGCRWLDLHAEGGQGRVVVGSGPVGLNYAPVTWRFFGGEG